MRTLAAEIKAYLEAQGKEPYFPPPTEVLVRWAKRAATLAEVRNELQSEVNKEKHIGQVIMAVVTGQCAPLSVGEVVGKIATLKEQVKKLEAVAEAAKAWRDANDATSDLDSSDEEFVAATATLVKAEEALEAALAALEEE